MTRRTVARISIAGLAGLVVSASVVWFVYRPWALTWGSTDDEIARRMPGDDVVANPSFSATRAVTVEAPPERIWPWIVQMGYQRAGFYSWDRLDNDGVPSAEHILPEYQDLSLGDLIPLSSDADARVTVLEPNTALVLVFEVEGTWEGSHLGVGALPGRRIAHTAHHSAQGGRRLDPITGASRSRRDRDDAEVHAR